MGNEASGPEQGHTIESNCSSCNCSGRSQTHGTWRQCEYQNCPVVMCGRCKKTYMFRRNRGQWRCAAHHEISNDNTQNVTKGLALNTRLSEREEQVSTTVGSKAVGHGADGRSRVAKVGERPVSDRHPATKRDNPPTPQYTPGTETLYRVGDTGVRRKHEPNSAFSRQPSDLSLSHISFGSIPSLTGMFSESASEEMLAALNALPLPDQHMTSNSNEALQRENPLLSTKTQQTSRNPQTQHEYHQSMLTHESMNSTSGYNANSNRQVSRQNHSMNGVSAVGHESRSQWDQPPLPMHMPGRPPMHMQQVPVHNEISNSITHADIGMHLPRSSTNLYHRGRQNGNGGVSSGENGLHESFSSMHQKSMGTGQSFGQSQDSLEVLQQMMNAKPAEEPLRLGPLKEEPSGTGSKPRPWNEHEDRLLEKAVNQYGAKHWKTIATFVPNRTHVQCLQRWNKVLKPGLQKGGWSGSDDKLLIELVKKSQGEINWKEIALQVRGRTSKQCRERYYFYLSPNIKKGPWTPAEDAILLKAQEQFGNKWARIAKLIDGRTENAAKIRHKSLMRAMVRQWKEEEDKLLLELHQQVGKNWSDITKHFPNRSKHAIKLRVKHLTSTDQSDSQQNTTDSKKTSSVSTSGSQTDTSNGSAQQANGRGTKAATRKSNTSAKSKGSSKSKKNGAKTNPEVHQSKDSTKSSAPVTKIEMQTGDFQPPQARFRKPNRMEAHVQTKGHDSLAMQEQQIGADGNHVLQAMMADLTTLDVDSEQSNRHSKQLQSPLTDSLNTLQFLDQVASTHDTGNTNRYSHLDEPGLAMISPQPLIVPRDTLSSQQQRDSADRHQQQLRPNSSAGQYGAENRIHEPNQMLNFSHFQQPLLSGGTSAPRNTHAESSFGFSQSSFGNIGTFSTLGSLESLDAKGMEALLPTYDDTTEDNSG